MSANRLVGEIPSPVHPPDGCRFHPRCPVAISTCSTDDPPVTDFGAGHYAACHVAAAALLPEPEREKERELS